jgi:predicted amidohydrolase YtcJ
VFRPPDNNKRKKERPPDMAITRSDEVTAGMSMPVAGLVPRADGTEPADLVVRNARVFTGDPRRPAASAVAIGGGRILNVSDDHGVARHVAPSTRVVDVAGRRVIPGLIDSHMHVIRTGLHYLLELRWDGVRSLAQALWMLREQAARTPPGQWVRVVGGWSKDQFAEQRLPTVSELNAAAPDTPVMITHLYQSVLLNRAAVTAAGLTRDTPEVPGGQIVRDHAGNPTGMLLAAPAAGLLYATIGKAPVLDPAGQVESTRRWLAELNRFGLTSAIDAAGGFQSFPEHYAAVQALAEAGELSVRLAYHLFPQIPRQELDDIRRWIATLRPGEGDDWLRLNGAGESLAWSLVDFENFAEPRPELPDRAAADLEAAARLLIENGWGFRLHATYDQTIRMDLEVFEKIGREGEFPRGVRWILDHAETISPESIDRVAALGGAISVQHRMVYQGRAFAERYGPAAAAAAPPIRAMLDRGLTVAAGTDAPRVSTYNPWVALEWLVRGRTIGGLQLYGPGNLVDRETALAMYTTAGAQLTGEAGAKGILAEGYLADLAVLSEDYFTVPAGDISRIESVLTVTGGKIVHAAADYEGLAAPPPPIEPTWSPVARYGGYHQPSWPARHSGADHAGTIAEAAADSEEQRHWRTARGLAPEAATGRQREDSCAPW